MTAKLNLIKFMSTIFIPRALQRSWRESLLVSLCPSVCPPVCAQTCIRSVSSLILTWSISCLYTLSTSFSCVACWFCKSQNLNTFTSWLGTSRSGLLWMWGHIAWWRHQMEIFSALQALCAGNSPVPGEFPAERPVTRSFDILFDPCPNKRLSKQSWGWWFQTPSRSL